MNKNITIRRARETDVPRIVEIYLADPLTGSREAPVCERPSVYGEAFRRIDADPAQHLLVAEMDGLVVGTAQVTLIQYLMCEGIRVALVESVFVHPEHQGRRIGSVLMRAVIETAREWNCRRVELTSNKQRPDAHAFYGKLGFVATHEGFKLPLVAQ